jgi:hypothetical protein
MRVLAEEVYLGIRISIFHMNQKYIVKLERGPFEQVYKLSEFDFTFSDSKEVMNHAKSKIVDLSVEIFDKMALILDENF